MIVQYDRAASSSPTARWRRCSPWRASTCWRWPGLSASTCPETMSEPRRFSRRVPTPRRALESRPQELDSCNSRWATQSDDSSWLCFLLLSAKRACSFERRLTRSRLSELQRQSWLRDGSLRDFSKVLKTPTVVPCGSSFVASGLLTSADIEGVQSRCRPLHTDLHIIEIDFEVWGMSTAFNI